MISSAYLRSSEAPSPRTLYDIFTHTATAFPEAAAIDDGSIITYRELLERVQASAHQLHAAGVRPGSRIGVRMASGHSDLYIAILSILAAGAAYVPVDADDPDERAELVFSEAAIQGFYDDNGFHPHQDSTPVAPAVPALEDTAWIIFTSGSTGKPKGVAVSHRSAAAFVDAESQLFLQDAPIGPDGSGAGGAFCCIRCFLRRDVAGMGTRRLFGSGPAFSGALRDGSWPVAHSPRHHRRFYRAHVGGALAYGGARQHQASPLGRRSLFGGARREAIGSGTGSMAPPRPPWSLVRRCCGRITRYRSDFH